MNNTNIRILLLRSMCLSFLFFTSQFLNAQHVITDDDVVVTNGVIDSICVLYFRPSNVIIPDTLDGQAVTEIGDNLFKGKIVSSVVLPSTLTYIGEKAFYSCSLTNVDFSNCSSLLSIGRSAFSSNSIETLNFSSCTSLTTIGPSAFTMNNINSVEFENCNTLTVIGDGAFMANNLSTVNLNSLTSLTTIGGAAFYTNKISRIELNECTALSEISDFAFYDNNIDSIDLTECRALTYIGTKIFLENPIKSLILPTPDSSNFNYWIDVYSNKHSGEDLVYDFNTHYIAKFTLKYDLTITVSDGIKAIKGAKITLNDADYTTDESGQVTITDIMPGVFPFSVFASGYEYINDYLDVFETITQKDISLKAITTDINDVLQSNIKIYPNPASSILNIFSDKTISAVRIYNLTGQTIYIENNFASVNSSVEIDVSTFPQGIYLVNTFVEGENNQKRVIIE